MKDPFFGRVHGAVHSRLALNSVLFAVPMASFAIISLVSVPILIGSLGPTEWSAVVAAQALGGIGAIVIAFGWGATGPIAAASTGAASRPELYLRSLVSRGYLALIAVPLCVALSARLVLPDATILLASAGASFSGLSATWYFIGVGRPIAQLLYDTTPRVLGSLSGLVLTALSGTVLPYVLLTAIGTLFAVVASAIAIVAGTHITRYQLSRTLAFGTFTRTLKQQAAGAVTVIAASSYANMPIVLVQTLSPTTAPLFNMAFKLMRFGATALLPAMQSIQAWAPSGSARRHRLGVALAIALALSLIGGLATGLATPLLSSLLSQHALTADGVVAALVGIGVFAIAASQHTGLTGLVIARQQRALATSTVLGGIVGVPAVAFGVVNASTMGAMLGVVVAELVVLGWQLSVYLPTLYSMDSREESGG